MFHKSIFIYLILTSLFSQVIMQSNILPRFNNKKLQSFANCVIEKIDKSEFNEISSQVVLSLMMPSRQTDYKKLRETFTKYFDKISDCLVGGYIPKLPDGSRLINLDEILKTKYDWPNFISCLMSKINDIEDSPFSKIIKYINEEKYLEAIREEFKLRNKGNEILKECMPVKIGSLLNKNK